MADVQLRSVEKVYPGGVKAIHGVDLAIADGELAVLVGPSGCGKSTLLRMVAGLEEITAGEISIGGRVVNRLEPADRDIAMVFQNYALYPHMSVFDNMAYGLRNRRTPKDEIRRRVDEAAGILGIQMLLDRKPRQLSGGQRQRVAMGRAIVREPAVFLFDEAAVQSRREAARADAAGDQAAAAPARHDQHLCDARPDGSDDPGRQAGRPQRRARGSRSAHRSTFTSGPRPPSSPPSSARRR